MQRGENCRAWRDRWRRSAGPTEPTPDHPPYGCDCELQERPLSPLDEARIVAALRDVTRALDPRRAKLDALARDVEQLVLHQDDDMLASLRAKTPAYELPTSRPRRPSKSVHYHGAILAADDDGYQKPHRIEQGDGFENWYDAAGKWLRTKIIAPTYRS